MLKAPSPTVSLKRRTLSAGAWSIGGFAASQMVRMASNLVMTRLLVPEMFGVMAIAYLIMTGLSLFSDVGLSQNVVQSEHGNHPGFLNTVWAVQILRGVLLWLVALAIALFILVADHFKIISGGQVYAEPKLPYVIAAVSFTAVIAGARTTKFYEANRHLAFGRLTVIRFAAQITGMLCMFIWASIDRSIWALVAGGLCSSSVEAVLGQAYLSGSSNRWHWDPSAFTEIIRFGKWLFLSSILSFLANGGDRLILAGIVSSATLGVYVIAFLLFNSVEQIMGGIISSVAFPALSEIARKGGNMRAAYYRIHTVVAAIAYFSGGFLIIAGQSIVDVLYDHRYMQAGWMLEILAVGLFAIPSQIGVQYYLAFGKSGMSTIVAATRLCLLVILLPSGFYFFGLHGAVWGITISYLSYLPVTVLIATRYALFDIRKELIVLPAILFGMTGGKLFVGVAPTAYELVRKTLSVMHHGA